MSKNYDSIVPDCKLTEEEEDLIVSTALSLSKKIFYRKKNEGYECFCTACLGKRDLSAKELRVLQSSQVCPMCFRAVVPSTKEEWSGREWVKLLSRGYTYQHGYRVNYTWSFDRELRYTLHRSFYAAPKAEYRRDCVRNMGFSLCLADTKGHWKECRASWYSSNYASYFTPAERKPVIVTLRQYYESMGIELKSNQIGFVKKYVLNRNQIGYVQAFSLNSIDEVLKYSGYMKKNPIEYIWRHPGNDPVLNVTYLEYLKKNGITLSDYRDYIVQCLELGQKPDKPRDFAFRHERNSELVISKNNAENDRLITERLPKLPEIFVSGCKEIRPFRSALEIIRCGKTLHMCIGMYVGRYAAGATDLFCLYTDGKLTGAIEVTGGVLIQARGDRNEDITGDPAVKKWFRQLGKENNERNQRIPQAAA